MIKLNFLVKELKSSKVIAIPTDTIYGLSVLPNTYAINKLLALKKRDKNKGFIILTSSFDYVTKYLNDENLLLLKNANENLKKPTTFIVPSNHLLAVNGTIAIRKTDNKLIQYICDKLGSAIISTSANISGKKPIDNTICLKKYFNNKINYYPAQKNNNLASSIVNLISKEVYR